MKKFLSAFSVIIFLIASIILLFFLWTFFPELIDMFLNSDRITQVTIVLGGVAALYTASAVPVGLATLISSKNKATQNNNNSHEYKLDNKKPKNTFLSTVETACRLQHNDETVKIKRREHDEYRKFPHLYIENTKNDILYCEVVAIIEYDITKKALQNLIKKIDKKYRKSDPRIRVEIIYGGEKADPTIKQLAKQQGIELIHLAQYKGLLDFTNYLKEQQINLETNKVYPPKRYVNQRLRYGNQDKSFETDNAIQIISEWLQQDHRHFLLILGDFGTGKTFLLRELARRFHQNSENIIPILLEMRSLEKTSNLNQLLAQQLAATMPFDGKKFQYMLNQGQIILFFDGFDELALRVTYETALAHFGTLIEAAQGKKAKVVVTSRTQHFRNKQQVKLKLLEHLESIPSHRITELKGFNRAQILEYLEKHLGDKQQAQRRFATIDRIKDLMGLSENPRMLSFIVRLSDEQLEAAQDAKGEITAADLYQIILDDWLNLEQKRVKTGRKDDLSLAQRWQAVTELALVLWQRTEKTIKLDELNTDVVNTLENLSINCETATQQIGSGTLLVRDEDSQFGFIHQSVMEWLLAKHIADAFQQQNPAKLDHLLTIQTISALMADFLCDLLGHKQLTAWAKNHIDGTELILQKNTRIISRRLNIRENISKDFSGQDLQGEDFSGQNLSNSDFSQANLSNANFDQATLIGCTFSQAQCQSASFKQANCQSADFKAANLKYSVFNHADLQDTDFTSADLYAAAFLGINDATTIWQAKDLRLIKYLGKPSQSLASLRYWGASCHTKRQLIAQHSLMLSGHAIAYHPTLAIIALASGHCITLWDLNSYKCLHTLNGHQGSVRSVAFRNDGQQLASGSDDHTIKLWDTPNGAYLHTLNGHQGSVSSVAFRNDGQQLASGSGDKTIKLWDTANGACLHTLNGHQDTVNSVTFRNDGQQLASSSNDQAIKLWDTANGACLHTLNGHQDTVNSVAFRNDGQQLASGSNDQTIKLWDMANGTCLHTLNGHQRSVRSVAFRNDGQQLASGSGDRTIKLWDTDNGACLHTLNGHQHWVNSVAFRNDGRQIASGSYDRTIKLWDTAKGTCLHTFNGHEDWVTSVAFRNDGQQLASSSYDRTIKLWDTANGACLHTLKGNQAWVSSVVLCNDGRQLASSSYDGTIKLWDTDNGDCLHTLNGHQDTVRSVAFRNDGQQLASGSNDQTVKLWDTAKGTCLHNLKGHQNSVRSVAFRNDGQQLASGSHDHTIKLWDTANGTCLHTFYGHQGSVNSVAFRNDGRQLASGSADQTIKLWDTANGACLHTLNGHQASVRSVAFRNDGQQLVSGSNDKTIKLWDTANGRCLHTLNGHQDAVNSVAFSPDGLWLASGSDDNSIRLWRVNDGRCVAILVAFEQGWVAYTPDGRYKYGGNLQGNFWHSINLCRFEVGELDPYWHERLHLDDNEPLLDMAVKR